MIRAVFLIERTGEQLACLLNPSDLVFRRTAGLARRPSLHTSFTGGVEVSDEPLLFTGGGLTELDLDLLFDVSIAGSTSTSEDVRDLTRPLWQLAENGPAESGLTQPPLVRFVWGKSWNFPGVVAAVSERFDLFDASGVPRRSWLRLKMKRIDDRSMPGKLPAQPDAADLPALPPIEATSPLGDFPLPPAAGPTAAEADRGDRPYLRLDLLAYLRTGDPAAWRADAAARGVIDPLRVPADVHLPAPEGASA